MIKLFNKFFAKRASGQAAKNPWMIFLVTAMGVGMASIDGSIVNVALPTLVHKFQTTMNGVQWIVSGYILMICVLLPLSGYLSDIYSKKSIYLLGFLIFTISSALCGTAFSLIELVIFRLFQGAGAAMILANNQAILMSSFPKGKRGRALGINSMLVAMGSIAGPGIGGLLIGYVSWRAIFYINIPLGVIGCYLGMKILLKDPVKPTGNFDFVGLLLFSLIMSSFVIALSNSDVWGWGSTQMRVIFLIVLVGFGLFIIWENQAKKPMVDLSLFKRWVFSSGNVVAFIVFLALTSNLILLPFYLEHQLLMSPQMTGMIMFVAPIFIVFVAPISGHLADKMNQIILIGVGLAIMFAGLFGQSFLTANSHISAVIIHQALIGIGCGLFSSPNNYSMLSSVPSEKLGKANSITSLGKNVGKVCGVAIATAIFTIVRMHVLATSTKVNKEALAFSAGLHYALLSAALFVLLGLLITFSRWKYLRNGGEQEEVTI